MTMDELTGLPTRADLPLALAELRTGPPPTHLTAILFDIDGMVWINLQRGHVEGDAVLGRIGRWLDARAREARGKAFRVGGEEFLFLLPKYSLDEALVLARDVIRDCERLQIPYAREGVDREFLALNAAAFIAPAEFQHVLAQLREAAAHAIYAAKLAQGRRYSVVATLQL
jgi:diguanylate cyclase (GGDEF)-like protein